MNGSTIESEAPRAALLAEELRLLFGKLKRRLREQAGSNDLTISQISVLSRLEREGAATVTNLARAEAMRPQSMGALHAERDPADGRQTLWSLTSECRAWIRTTRAARQDWLFHAIEKNLTADEQDDLARALPLLKRLAES